jgi:hypothetical protein
MILDRFFEQLLSFCHMLRAPRDNGSNCGPTLLDQREDVTPD